MSVDASAPAISPGVRAWRAAWLTLWAIALASAGHLLAGGHSPALFVIIVAAIIVGSAAWVVSARTLTWWAGTGLLAGTQLLVHLLGVWSMPSQGGASANTHASMVGMGGSLEAGSTAASAPMQLTWLMLSAHLAAALVSALLVAAVDGQATRACSLIAHTLRNFFTPLALSTPAFRFPRVWLAPVQLFRPLCHTALSCAGPRAPPRFS